MSAEATGPDVSAALGTLAALVGEWEGTSRTWFEPDVLAGEATQRARIRHIGPPAEAGFVLYEYDGATDGDPFQGVAIVGVEQHSGRFVSAWVDSMHQSTAIMLSKGDEQGATTGAPPTVTGAYRDPQGGPDWGWRTEFRLDGPDRLIVTAYNITPSGAESKGVETIYTRRGASP
jgi:hypothetical protein